MLYMNTWEIDQNRQTWRRHSLLGPATQTLANLRDAADANSDGWAYWPKPARAARKLIQLINGENQQVRWNEARPDVTLASLRAAYAPIKAFRTRTGIQFEIVEP